MTNIKLEGEKLMDVNIEKHKYLSLQTEGEIRTMNGYI